MDEVNAENLAARLTELQGLLEEYVLADQGIRVTKRRRFIVVSSAIKKALDKAIARAPQMVPAIAGLYTTMEHQLDEKVAEFEMENRETAQKEEVGLLSESLSKILRDLGDQPSAETKQKARAQMHTINKDVDQYRGVDKDSVDLCLKNIRDINTVLFEDSMVADMSFLAAPRALSDSTHIARAQHGRVETKTLPIFSGKIESFASFKRAFIARMELHSCADAEASTWLSSSYCMKDTELMFSIQNMDYESQWRLLDRMFGSQTATTRRMMACLSPSGKPIRYGPELVKFSLSLHALLEYMDGMEPGVARGKEAEAMLVAYIDQMVHRCPGKLADELNKQIASMEVAKLEKLTDLIDLHSKYEAEKPSVAKAAAHVADGAGGRGRGGDVGRKALKKDCGMGCEEKHWLSKCSKYRGLDSRAKLAAVVRMKRCKVCLSDQHQAPCPKQWECIVDGCSEKHHGSLHQALIEAKPNSYMVYRHQGKTSFLGLQKVVVKEVEGVVLYDGGSNVQLITEEFVEKAGLQVQLATLEIGIPGSSMTSERCCQIPLVDTEGNIHVITAAVVPIISQRASGIPAEMAAAEFGGDYKFDDIIARDVDMLIGISDQMVYPVEVKRSGSAYLYRSIFGNRFFATGSSSTMAITSKAMLVKSEEYKLKPIRAFLEAEEMGTEVPKRCARCQGCKFCDYRNQQLSWTDKQELECIEKSLSFQPNLAQWVCEYPTIRDISELPNNYNLAVQLHRKLLEKLVKTGKVAEFSTAFEEVVGRGVFMPLTASDKHYKGPIHYIPMVEAYKAGEGATTKLRICNNSSMPYQGKCLNDFLVKGPSSMNSLWSIIIQFRMYQVGMVLDIIKFYNTIKSSERDQHIRRILWSPVVGAVPTEFKTMTATFGDKSAGCASITALFKTAQMYKSINPEASLKIEKDSYVDDIVSGAGSRVEVLQLDQDMRTIAGKGGFKFKPTVFTGDDVPPMAILGIEWGPKEDTLSIRCKVNVSGKFKGVHIEADLDLDDLATNMPENFTLRETWSICAGQYDPPGFLCPITIQLKLVMRALSGGKVDKDKWDAVIPEEVATKLKKVVLKLKEARQVMFSRKVVPDYPTGKPSLAVFCDGSQEAFCALVYIMWPTTAGVKVFLVTGKAKVGPSNQVTVVRMELCAAVLACRLASSVKYAVSTEFMKEYYFTDSTATLGLIQADTGALATYGGNRVGEIRQLSNKEDWLWVPSGEQVADIGTRTDAMPCDLGTGSRYQDGPAWLRLPVGEWPAKSRVGEAPREELSSAAKKVLLLAKKEVLMDPARYKSFTRMTRVLARVLYFLGRIRGKQPKMVDMVEYATNYIISNNQAEERKLLQEGKLANLAAKEVSLPAYGVEVKVVVMSGRTPQALVVGYDAVWLPVVNKDNPLADLCMYDGHIIGHGGVAQSIARTRSKVWVTSANTVAKKVVKNCYKCKLVKGSTCSQQMAALPDTRVLPVPPFLNIALDLFGPLPIIDAVKRRTSGKSWGIMVVCQATSAVSVELAENYSSDAFLSAFRSHVAKNGIPNKIVSDLGTQLVAAAKEVEKWDWDSLQSEIESRYDLEWQFTPVGSPHTNGQAERHIRMAKELLAKQLADKKMTFGELSSVLSEVVHIINSKPYQSGSVDPATGLPLTPLHILGPRGRLAIPGTATTGKVSLKRRFDFIQSTVADFWAKYQLLVFPSKIKFSKWTASQENVAVGDVVQLLDPNLVSRTWKLALVTGINTSSDGRVRAVQIKVAGTSLKAFEVAVQRIRHVFSPSKAEE